MAIGVKKFFNRGRGSANTAYYVHNKMDGWPDQAGRFAVDASRFKPRLLEVYGGGLCPPMVALNLIMIMMTNP